MYDVGKEKGQALMFDFVMHRILVKIFNDCYEQKIFKNSFLAKQNRLRAFDTIVLHHHWSFLSIASLNKARNLGRYSGAQRSIRQKKKEKISPLHNIVEKKFYF